MLEKLTSSLLDTARSYAVKVRESQKKDREKLIVDPHEFNDPIALKLSWSPNSSGGANFRTGKLSMNSNGEPRIEGTGGMHLFGLVFAGLGSMALLFMVPLFFSQQMEWFARFFVIIPLFVGLAFLLIGSLMIENGFRRFRFERRGLLRDASFASKFISHEQLQELFITKDDMAAIQIVGEKVTSSDGPDYFSFELNLVTKDLSRFTLEDHRDLPSLREDGGRLSRFLEIPLWDGTAGKF